VRPRRSEAVRRLTGEPAESVAPEPKSTAMFNTAFSKSPEVKLFF
jgi:hypothetical protein